MQITFRKSQNCPNWTKTGTKTPAQNMSGVMDLVAWRSAAVTGKNQAHSCLPAIKIVVEVRVADARTQLTTMR